MMNFTFRGTAILAICCASVLSTNLWAYCGTDTNQNHVLAGRAETYTYGVYARAVGSGDELGFHYSDSSTLNETSPGHYEQVASCGGGGGIIGTQPTAPYANASELVADDIINERGKLGVALTGNHLVNSPSGDIPWENKVSTSQTVNIPAGATIKHAFLYYSGSIALSGGDFTDDNLGSFNDVINNGITFHIGGESYGPFDTNNRKPPNEGSVGSTSEMLAPTYFDYGTLTGTNTSFWGSRLDITGIVQDRTSTFTISVDAPEEVDVSANAGNGQNGGNPAGDTLYNSCSSVANWSVLVIYEHDDIEPHQIIVKDPIIRAWDYAFIHNGVWERPFVTFEHDPIQLGTKIYAYAATGTKGSRVLPMTPVCTCGCGGRYILEKSLIAGDNTTSRFWSNILVNPESVDGDPMDRDSTNGPWAIATDAAQSVNGNDWTLFQSGNTFTEFPNLWEGENVSADTTQPITNEDSGVMAGDVYGGHPWQGRGDVTYHGWGNSTSVIEIALNDNAITPGETESILYFKGDQKDIFKPQSRVTLRYLVMSIPIDSNGSGSAPPVITLTDDTNNYASGDTYAEAGFSAMDDVDGDVTAQVTVECNFNTVAPLAAGTSECTYSVSDSDNNTASVTRSIEVASVETCLTATISEHLTAGRAYESYYGYYATGSGDLLGYTISGTGASVSLDETSEGNWEEVTSCDGTSEPGNWYDGWF